MAIQCMAIKSDTPQFRGGNPYFFSENLYQSVSFLFVHRCVAKTFISRCSLQNNREPAAIKEPKSELYVTWSDSRIRPPLID